MRCAIYARVSTEHQDYDAAQLPDLRDFVRRWGWETEVTEYVEKLSGKEGNRRPQLEKLMEACKNGKIDVVVVWKLDRFGRSALDTLENIRSLSSYRVRFVVSTNPAIDTDDRSPTGKFILQIFAAVAELDRAFILERTHRGQQAYIRQFAAGHVGTLRHSKSGKDLPVGRPRGVYGKGENRCLADKVKMRDMHDAGLSFRAIGRKVGISDRSVRRLLAPA